MSQEYRGGGGGRDGVGVGGGVLYMVSLFEAVSVETSLPLEMTALSVQFRHLGVVCFGGVGFG